MMKAIVCDHPGQLRVVELPIPENKPGNVLLRIRRVGVCGTDMHIYKGTQPFLSYPRVMGHELAGEVVEAPADSGLVPGDAVFVMPYLSCGKCIACRKGKTNCCSNIQVLGVHCDGGMAEYLSLPAGYVFRAEGITLDQAAMIEFLAIGAHAVKRGDVKAGQRILVVGAGPIGMAVMLFSRLAGADVTALDMREDRLEVCSSVLGVNHVVAVGEDDKALLAVYSDDEFFDVVFDATGNIHAMKRGLEFVAQGGNYVLVSIVQDTISFFDPEFHKRETSLLGSRNATIADFEFVLDTMRAGRIPTALLNTHRASLEDFPAVLGDWMNPDHGVIKAIVEC
ncbi:zinc-binding alcohol dehydrogenase family protein [Leeia oryzae]|uniref:zinc-binding alcohol dehydrogenase family protein n=1 Tax=Leeia oryzae TaxID=356662 RepID=UPI000378A5CD|nr:zinc-binding alcohol dehydrogenase family protein [Leeia oryzae]